MRPLPFHARAWLDRTHLGRLRRGATALMLGVLPMVWTMPWVARADSPMRLLSPIVLEQIGATTFDGHGQPIGRSTFDFEIDEDGERRFQITMAVDDGGSNISEATLVPAAAAAAGATSGDFVALELVEERSQAKSASGETFPLLVIDHRKRRVTCYPADQPESSASAAPSVEIPEEDRVVNVPMQLLFLPLVRGDVDSVRFQIATCARGPELHDMIAVRGPVVLREGRRVVEIEYGPDFGETLAFLASRLLPSFSFWFDADDATYLGHRMPLHRRGPEITMVRQGLTPPQLGID